jgi:MoaA/NifB/PqqE/SkfB family radical SAM enzyme
MSPVRLRRRIRRAHRRIREARMLVRSLRFRYRPVAAHLIPIRRCNLSCAYCNEYDDRSAPVPTGDVLQRIDRLVALGTGVVTLSGGEPLLHPDLDQIVSHIRRRGAIATLITNGYLLTPARIARLNRAGLDHLQISIDNVQPDEVSKKSLKVLDQKLVSLAAIAEFDVTVNSVVGSGIRNAEDALTVAGRARELGFSTTVGIIHDGAGKLLKLDEPQRLMLERVVALGKSAFDYANYNRFQKNLANGQPNVWQCRAGARYLYVCEDGLVHWCSQQRGRPGIPLAEYGVDDLHREYHTVKSCAPLCTVGCVHRVAQVDELREDPQRTLAQWFASPGQGQPPRLPLPVKILKWAFITSPGRDLFRRAVAGVSGGTRRR